MGFWKLGKRGKFGRDQGITTVENDWGVHPRRAGHRRKYARREGASPAGKGATQNPFSGGILGKAPGGLD